MWRAGQFVSTRSMDGSAGREVGAGEGNRTLVVSLEGFCSTIELHPLAMQRRAQCHCPSGIVNRIGKATAQLDRVRDIPLSRGAMAHLNATAATSTVRFWWRASTLAARWRD